MYIYLYELILIISITSSSGTKSPFFIKFYALKPSFVWFLISSLNKSPVAIAHIQNLFYKNWLWVPFPTPGGLFKYLVP